MFMLSVVYAHNSPSPLTGLESPSITPEPHQPSHPYLVHHQQSPHSLQNSREPHYSSVFLHSLFHIFIAPQVGCGDTCNETHVILLAARHTLFCDVGTLGPEERGSLLWFLSQADSSKYITVLGFSHEAARQDSKCRIVDVFIVRHGYRKATNFL